MDSKVRGGILLVAGTAIGAGMLALPVAMGKSGFIPSLAVFFLFWICMTYTALLMLEVNTWTGAGTNLITMARSTLGLFGAAISWSAYLFLLYALLTAYIAGSGSILSDLLQTSFPSWYYALPLVLLFATLLFSGMRPFEYLNRFLIAGLAITYICMVVLLMPHISLSKLERANWPSLFLSLSIVATSFGYHIVIPSLYRYLEGDSLRLQRTLLIGSTIPLAVYILWQMLALGIIPLDGPNGLLQGYLQGANGVHLLTPTLDNAFLALLAQLFSFCAIITSFLGVALSLHDFLADGLTIERTLRGKTLLLLLTFAPPLFIAAMDPTVFLTALEWAGTFGVVLLLILLPALMVWRGRYMQGRPANYRVPGGKPALVAVIAFACLVIVLEILKITHHV